MPSHGFCNSDIRVIGTLWHVPLVSILGSNDNNEGNENGKKAIGLDWQENNFARASRFFVHFFAVTAARLQRESA